MSQSHSTPGVLRLDNTLGDKGYAAVVVAIAVGFELLQRQLRRGRCRRFIESYFSKGQTQAQLSRDVYQAVIRLVGLFHLIVQLPVALAVLRDPHMQFSKLYSRSMLSQFMLLFSGGYFLHDLYSCLTRFSEWGAAYLIHSLVCCTLYSYATVTGFLHYFGAVFLLWESSTPFVYVRWFLHKGGQSDSTAYVINGFAMLAAFFSIRIVFGGWSSYDYFRVSGHELAHPVPGGMPQSVIWLYRIANLSLNALNLFWFHKMASGAFKLLSGNKQKKRG
mmetsp:Transcript_3200/g.9268  ORF Transcript_3200/g.9268 Transcript_3200/m.9268 type:complete len:276 (+) Transcript_3200:205-1032(+)|eukprot:CAMPEP_0206135578 /NCGR_PEP_ID=MMETSP1473-20131121/845_1 /ASSEMBLY_ACC=CAM_ASM_001109 /TAXON_ID=1461547 /ORGANISM="Stichococcus sp, Strain RCC1054" /LENGTH=275 /DNA_ID=CAMNT_0053527523 /DNA_START=110 /DNA_END=937 /DNA_ORIENTATION=+